MFCPHCGQERVSDATSFCSRCGYLLTGTAELLRTGGAPLEPPREKARSPRSRGIRLGLFMFLLMFLLAPLVGIISVFAIDMEPWPVGVVVFLLGVGGVLRMVYALMFESNDPRAVAEGGETRELYPPGTNFSTAALPPQRDIPSSEYTSPSSRWREDTVTQIPDSVTDNTTKLLEKERDEL
jgi:hypothetical protein